MDNPGLAALITSAGFVGFVRFPRNSDLAYVYSLNLMFGCVRGVDTLVTNGFLNEGEFLSFTKLQRLSDDVSNDHYDAGAIAPDEIRAIYSDTSSVARSVDWLDSRPHIPLGLFVQLQTYSWNGGFGQQILFLDWSITSTSPTPLHNAYVGFVVEPTAQYLPNWPMSGEENGRGAFDDICGFIKTAPGPDGRYEDSLMLAWSADNDGDPSARYQFDNVSVPDALGIRILRVDPPASGIGFNWWAREEAGAWPSKLDWGPRLLAARNGYAGSLGSPAGDRMNYWMMRNGEIDYDQVYSDVDMTRQGWSPPSNNESLARAIADGSWIQYMLSAGPLPDLYKGDTVHLTVALVIGRDFHRNPRNLTDNFNASDPTNYLNNLDFSNLIQTARWADWIYDNPGVDTDGDGNKGKFVVSCDGARCDTIYYKGDGVPDWRGPSAPPPPDFELITRPSGVTLRWTGFIPETAKDPFSDQRDFEGYRLYMGRFDRNEQYSLITSWDRLDYVRMAYDPRGDNWVAISYPQTEQQWRMELSDADFRVADHSEPDFSTSYQDIIEDTIRNVSGEIIRIEKRTRYSYWSPFDVNRANAYVDAGRLEHNIIQQVETRDTVIEDEHLTFGVYEANLDRLNAAVPLYIALTTFDFGDYRNAVAPQESAPTSDSKYAEFIYSPDIVVDSGLKVSVYPNPYKISYRGGHGNRTTYYQEGFEGRGIRQFEEQDRRIHFINLPDTATISIYTLDGDLVRRIYHPDPHLTTYPSSVGWDLVTRNVQAVVSGIYIWRVESRLGAQMGKLVIIK